MLTQKYELDQVISGSPEQKELAATVLRLLRAHGQFMSTDASVRVTISSLVEFLDKQGETDTENRLRAAVGANPAVLQFEELNGVELVTTTRAGLSPTEFPLDVRHTFVRRLMTPLPKPEVPPTPRRERARVDIGWASIPSSLDDLEPGMDLDDFIDFSDETVAEDDAALVAAVAVDEPVTIAPAPVAEPPAPVVEPVIEEPVFAPAAVNLAPDQEPRVAEPAPVAQAAPAAQPAPVIAPAPVVPPPPVAAAPVAPPRVVETRSPVLSDMTGVEDPELAAAIRDRLSADPRIASFGDQWMMEERTPRFSRNDLRRFREYLQEQEQPLTDDALAQDVLGVRSGSQDFDVTRFAINYRLSREKEFEFVGVANQRFWSISSLPQIGTSRRKPNELGADYRYLLEETAGVEPRTVESVDHTLTFFEYVHGLLPLDADMQRLLPGPLLPGQRSAVLTFECPQTYTTYLVEVRYPTPNRGGFVLGLDDFYTESLVPGAIISINRTANDGQYRVEYITENNQSARLLELDDRRAERYVFRPTTFSCGVDERLLLREERFGKLNGDKPLDDKARRRPESVVAATFERVGEEHDGNYRADFDTLFAAVNIERPISATLLRSTLDHDDTGAFSLDPEGNDAYTYVPGATP